MHDLTLTRNFVERWEKRVGNWPTVEAVRHYLEQSIPVQRCEDFTRPDGTPFRMLAIYWHPELDLAMKIDTKLGVAVTVISRNRYLKRMVPGIKAMGHGLTRMNTDCGQDKKENPVDPVILSRPSFAARIARVRERFGIRKIFAQVH